MPPEITDFTEIRFEVSSKQTLRVREFTPKTNSDFVVTSSGAAKDQGVISKNAAPSVSDTEGQFYSGPLRIDGDSNAYVQNSRNTRSIVVQLEDK